MHSYEFLIPPIHEPDTDIRPINRAKFGTVCGVPNNPN